MRRSLLTLLGAIALIGAMAAPVSAAPVTENGWDAIIGGRAFNSCTGEWFDNNGKVHNVNKDTSGLFHYNVHVVGVGETSGQRYQYNAGDNEQVQASPDGTFTFHQVINFGLVSQGGSSNLRLTLRLTQVFDANGN